MDRIAEQVCDDIAQAIYDHAHRPQNWRTYGIMPSPEEISMVIRKLVSKNEESGENGETEEK